MSWEALIGVKPLTSILSLAASSLALARSKITSPWQGLFVVGSGVTMAHVIAPLASFYISPKLEIMAAVLSGLLGMKIVAAIFDLEVKALMKTAAQKANVDIEFDDKKGDKSE